jgi:hypothetical protein
MIWTPERNAGQSMVVGHRVLNRAKPASAALPPAP